MSCYAEVDYIDANDDRRRMLIRLENKEEREYIIFRFEATAGPDERIRRITRQEARKEYDISRFGKLPYADLFIMANPNRPGHNWRFDAIEPTAVYEARRNAWVVGRGRGTQLTLLTDGE